MNNRRNATLIIILIFSSFGCGTSPKDYQNTEPEFDLKTFFAGELIGWGLVKNYQDKVTKRFTVEMIGTWQENQGELYELFTYQDGTTQERTWYFVTHEGGINTGTAGDVVGQASGQQQGFAFNWNYDLLFKSDGKQIQVHLKDWLYQVDENVVISQAKIQKFGVEVGEVIVVILKQDEIK